MPQLSIHISDIECIYVGKGNSNKQETAISRHTSGFRACVATEASWASYDLLPIAYHRTIMSSARPFSDSAAARSHLQLGTCSMSHGRQRFFAVSARPTMPFDVARTAKILRDLEKNPYRCEEHFKNTTPGNRQWWRVFRKQRSCC